MRKRGTAAITCARCFGRSAELIPPPEWCENWLVHTVEMVDRYQPKRCFLIAGIDSHLSPVFKKIPGLLF